MSDENSATTLLEICEAAARGMQRDYFEGPASESDWRCQCQNTFDRFVSELNYMKKKALSTTWTDKTTFKDRIQRCVAIEEMELTPPEKECVRSGTTRCMACNLPEEKNLTAVSLFGYKSPKAFTSLDRLAEDFEKYIVQYDTVLNSAQRPEAILAGEKASLPIEDGGMFLIGETCLARAKLAFMCSTRVADMCLDAHLTAVERSEVGSAVHKNTFYHTTPDDDVPRFMNSFAEMKRMCAKEVEDTDKFGYDQNYWMGAWKARLFATGTRTSKDRRLLRLLGERARDPGFEGAVDKAWAEKMVGSDPSDSDYEEEESEEEGQGDDSEEDFVDEDESGIVSARRAAGGSRRKRRRVVEEEDEEPAEAAQPPARREAEEPRVEPRAPVKSHKETIIDKLQELKTALVSESKGEPALWVLEAIVELQKN